MKCFYHFAQPGNPASSKVAGWAELDLTVSEWAGIIVGVVCLWILISVVLACFCGPDFVTCHLCQQQGRKSCRASRLIGHLQSKGPFFLHCKTYRILLANP